MHLGFKRHIDVGAFHADAFPEGTTVRCLQCFSTMEAQNRANNSTSFLPQVDIVIDASSLNTKPYGLLSELQRFVAPSVVRVSNQYNSRGLQ